MNNLAVGQTATFNWTIFPLITDVEVTIFTEINAAFQQDPDSTPGNGDGTTANEDDEAVIILNSSGSVQPFTGTQNLSFTSGNMAVNALYPNPAISQVMINLVSMKDVTAKISIVNTNGQIVEQLQQAVNMGVNTLQFDVSNFPVGNYYLHIEGVVGEKAARQFTKTE